MERKTVQKGLGGLHQKAFFQSVKRGELPGPLQPPHRILQSTHY